MITLQQLHSLRRIKLTSSTPGRKLRLELVALRLLPSSSTELELHIVPALGDDPLANMFPTVCFPNLRRLALYFGAVPVRVREAEPFQATDALCPLLIWLKVVGPNPCMLDDSESDKGRSFLLKETLSAQFLTRFPAIQTLCGAEGQVRDFRRALAQMPHLVAARLHLPTRLRLDFGDGDTFMWLPVLQHLQMGDVVDNDEDKMWHEVEGPKYDLSAMPNLKWAILVGPYLRCPFAIQAAAGDNQLQCCHI